jgi:hypothetical protein
VSVPVRRTWTVPALALVLGLVWAVYLYRPLEDSPLPPWDFAILIEVFQTASSFLGRFAAIAIHLSREGRLFLLTSLGIDAHWSVFGWNTVAWQVARFIEMVPVLVLVWYVLRRLGASQLGALFGSALFIGSGAAIQVWTLPQIMYWGGGLLFLGSLTLALGYQASRNWLRRAVGIAALLVGAAYVSETFIATAPFVLAVAVCRRADGTLGMPLASRRNVVLASSIAGAMLLFVVVPALVLRASSPERAYASQYSWANVSLARLGGLVRATVLPVTRILWFPGNLAFVGLIVAGLVVAWTRGLRAQTLWLLGLAALLPLAGIVVYLPWPVYEGYYGFQFLLGPAIAAAWALTVVDRSGLRLVRVGARVAAIIVLAYATLVARNAVRWERAARRVAVSASTALTAYPTATALVASPSPARDGFVGDALLRYARVRGLSPLPRVIDVACDDASVARTDGTPTVVLTLPEACEGIQVALGPPAEELRCEYLSRDWKTWRRERLVQRVSIWPLSPLHPSVSADHLQQGCMRSVAL